MNYVIKSNELDRDHYRIFDSNDNVVVKDVYGYTILRKICEFEQDDNSVYLEIHNADNTISTADTRASEDDVVTYHGKQVQLKHSNELYGFISVIRTVKKLLNATCENN